MASKKKKKNLKKQKNTAKQKAKKKTAKKQTGASSKNKKQQTSQKKTENHKKQTGASSKSKKQQTSKKKTGKNNNKQRKSFKEFFNKGKIFIKKYTKQLTIMVCILGLIILWNVAGLIVIYSINGTALPGTRVASIDVSCLRVSEIQDRLIQRGTPFLKTPITVRLNDSQKNFLPAELGISLLPRHTLQEIRFVSNETSLLDILRGLTKTREIPFYVAVDIEKAVENVEERFNFDEKKSKNAYITSENGELLIIPEKQGAVIDVHDFYNNIKRNANSLVTDPIEVKTKEHMPKVTVLDLEIQLDEINKKLNKTITFSHDTSSWDIKLINNLDWISFQYLDKMNFAGAFEIPLNLNGDFFRFLPEPLFINKELWISIDSNKFYAYVDETMSPALEKEPEKVSIYKDENEKIVIEGKGEDGQKIMKPHTLEAFVLAANHEISNVPIPLQIQKVAVEVSDDLRELGIKTLLGTGRSAFFGSPPNRIHNIGVGVNRYNGVIIEPGEVFSFNRQLGPVTAAAGYRPELVIKPEGTIPEYGGGLCQVSTTIYRAALFAGLPIVERAPHSYAVSYYAQVYGHGLDATIYIGARDVKFLNDTPGHILVQAYTEGMNAYFKFYGTDDGRHVELEGPYVWGWTNPGPAVIVESSSLAPGARRQVERPHTGFKAMWYRYLTKDGETTKEDIFSHYRAIPARILVGPGESNENE